MSTQRQYDWFIFPLDAHTNEVISRQVDAGDLFPDMLCTDRKKRNLFRCDKQMVNFLGKSITELGISFRIFGREKAARSDTGGKPRDVTFLFRGPKSFRVQTTQKAA